jgi:hypothetical protein
VGTDPEQLKHEIESTRRDLSSDVDALTEKVHPKRVVERRVGRARARIGTVREKVMGTPSGTGDGISSRISGAGTAAGSAASTVAEAASSTGAAMRRSTQGNPLAAGLIAFGAGWLVSTMLPASKREQEAASTFTEVARDAAQPVAQQAGQALSEMRDGIRQPAQQAVQQVRSAAGDAAGAVQDEARSSATEMATNVRDAGQRVRKKAGSDG